MVGLLFVSIIMFNHAKILACKMEGITAYLESGKWLSKLYALSSLKIF